MTSPLGIFDPTLVGTGWFDPEAMPLAWFDHDLLSGIVTIATHDTLPVAYRAALASHDTLPVSWSGVVNLATRDTLPVSWSGILQSHDLFPEGIRASLASHDLLPLAILASINARSGLPVAWRAALASHDTLPVSWSGVAVIATHDTLPVSTLARQASHDLLPVSSDGLPAGALALIWNVKNTLDAPLVLTWTVVGAASASLNPLTLTWTVRAAINPLQLRWRVVPNLVPPFLAPIQMPTAGASGPSGGTPLTGTVTLGVGTVTATINGLPLVGAAVTTQTVLGTIGTTDVSFVVVGSAISGTFGGQPIVATITGNQFTGTIGGVPFSGSMAGTTFTGTFSGQPFSGAVVSQTFTGTLGGQPLVATVSPSGIAGTLNGVTFTGSLNGDQLNAAVGGTPLGSDTSPTVITTKQTLELNADWFEVDMPEAMTFRNASPTDRVNQSYGYADVGSILSIVDGFVDEYELQITPRAVTAVVKGRDAGALALDTFFNRQYQVSPSGQILETINNPPPGSAVADPVAVGPALASTIAREACEAAGLTLQWEVRDYALFANFTARGRVIDTIAELVKPWNLVVPFRVDIVRQDTTLIVRPRVPVPATQSYPASQLYPTLAPVDYPVPTPDYTFTMADAARTGVRFRKRRLRPIGQVTLRPGGNANQTPGAAPSGGIFINSWTADILDLDGSLIETIEVNNQYLGGTSLLIESTKTTYSGPSVDLTTREHVTNQWEAFLRFPKVTAPQPSLPDATWVQSQQLIERSGRDPDGIFRILQTETTKFAYDSFGFLRQQTTLTRSWDSTNKVLVNSGLTSRTISDRGPLITEQITRSYAYDTDKQKWVFQSGDAQTGAGYRPGGPGRGNGTPTTGSGQSPTGTIQTATISTDPTAQPFEYSNPNLSLDDENFILTQILAADGLIEYEALMSGVAMPFVRTGMIVQFVGIVGEDGIEVPIPPLVITEAETRGDARSLTMPTIRGFGYAKT